MAGQQQAASAQERVWTIPELAEQIFLELPAQQVLIDVQRTCRQWKAVVEGSTPLQQALFFKPISSQRLHYDAAQPIIEHNLNWRSLYEQLQFTYPHTRESICPLQNPMLDLKRGAAEPSKQASENHHPSASWRRQLVTQPPFGRCDVRLRGGGKEVIRTIEAGSEGMMMTQLLDLKTENEWPSMVDIRDPGAGSGQLGIGSRADTSSR